MIIQEQDYLAHYGVLGMKWGKRKAGGNTPTTKPRSERQMLKERTKVVKIANKRSAKLTNNAIKKASSDLDDFNQKWMSKMDAKTPGLMGDYQKSPMFKQYTKEYTKLATAKANQYLKDDPKSKILGKSGEMYVAKILDINQGVVWGSESDWKKHKGGN